MSYVCSDVSHSALCRLTACWERSEIIGKINVSAHKLCTSATLTSCG